MTLSEDELSNLVVGLVQKGFIEISMEEGVESFELDGVYEALAAVLNQENTTAFIDRQDMLSQIVLYVETTYAKPCAPADLMIINSWLDLGYSYNEIKTAVLDSLKAEKLHLKYADAILKVYNLDSGEYELMCQRVKEAAKRFDYEVLSNNLIDIIEKY